MEADTVCADSNLRAFLQSDDLNHPSDDSLWVPSAASLDGGEAMATLDKVDGGGDTMDTTIFQSLVKEEIAEEDFDICFSSARKKRRLTGTQVQFLERSFAAENKLEPERKIQIAKEVGLQPRQVAIWFQNRRARYKNKQLEKDYECLKASFDKLKSDYDCLLKERESLQNEVDVLKEELVVREKGMDHTEAVERVNSLKLELQDLLLNVEEPTKMTMLLLPKQEDATSAKSDIFDSDSPISYPEPADSSHVFETEHYQSDHSQHGEHNVDLNRTFLPINSCSFDFPVEDDQAHPFWSGLADFF